MEIVISISIFIKIPEKGHSEATYKEDRVSRFSKGAFRVSKKCQPKYGEYIVGSKRAKIFLTYFLNDPLLLD